MLKLRSEREVWVAPFFGEFGWECSVWAPWLRHEQERRNVPFSVLCEKGKAGLYEDFSEVTEVVPQNHLQRDCQHAIEGQGVKKISARAYQNHCYLWAGRTVKCITPHDLPVEWPEGEPPRPKHATYVVYGKEVEDRNLVLVHARYIDRCKERNWARKKWDELAGKLKCEVFSIGSVEGAHWVDNTIDIRGCDVRALVDSMGSAKVVIGPSSGPLALALLCKAPVVWWSRNMKDLQRFDTAWNPHAAPNWSPCPTWDPAVEEVERTCQELLR